MKIKKLLKRWERRIPKSFLLFALLLANAINAQQGTVVTGTINDAATNTPLPGVNVIEKGTSNGTTTDFDGNFTLTVADTGATLLISYLGFKSQEVFLDGRTVITLQLEEDAQSLDEVVVVGYGTQKKSDLTGAVSSMDSEALTERSFNNPLEAIQGNLPGVQINQSTGRIGDGFDIVIRGNNSLNGSGDPLYIVDGVPTDGIEFLNPQDIERLDVLKDASSTAIYGSRGSNGVVIVTTKSGAGAKSGLTVSLDSYMGIREVARLPKMMDGPTWWYYHQSAYLATTNGGDAMNTTPEELHDAVIGSANSLLEERALNNDTFDWYDAVLKTGLQTNNYVNIAGRAENGLGYNLGLGYQDETGNVENESLKKYSFKAGIDHQLSEKISTGANFTLTMTQQQDGSDVAMREAFRLNPFLTPYGLDGELFPLPGKLVDENGDYLINKTSTYNPLLEIANTSDETRRWNIIGNIYLEYKPLEWLTLKSTYSAGYDHRRRGRAWGAMTNQGVNNNDLPSSSLDNYENFNYTWDNQFNVNYTLNDAHTFNFLGLQSVYYTRSESSFLSSRNQPFDTGFYNIGSGEQSTFNLGSNYVKSTLSSYALRLNYSYKGKYLITLSNRWDGSSLLSKKNRWDSFPSGALAWRVSEESFLQGSEAISNLKLRVSYGYTGNNVISPYSTLNGLDQQTYYDFGGSVVNGWLPSDLANSELGWEKTREFNFGLDFGFMSNRLFGSIDIYDRLSDDLLLEQSLPVESGWSTINANVGSVSNKGVEVALTGRIINTDKVSWELSGTFTANNNSIEEIYGQDEIDDVGNGWFIGESIDSQYNYVFDGIWQANERTEAESYGQSEGQAKVKDINGDGVIDPDDDRVILGSADPDWTGSLFTKVTFGGFDLSASLITNQGVFVYSPFHSNFTDTRDRGRQKLDIDWYVPDNTAGVEPQYSNNYPQPRNMGTYWRNEGVGYYRDASFVKIKNIALGYTLSPAVLDKLKIKHCRIYANVLNPFVFTDYDGYDPEWASAGLGIGRVSSVTYQLGINLKF
ncbi:SusC/RagA family TonB-linked outer membrane protein [Robertkochia solimangrovi]|uniref:SusC/RagA family TonB-linked outer membrane protein n=1 Tax=Robertkochia solimangrovi TaxID=2213046 RepID=UPI00117E71D7|nr:TonB-dependent receptor [Robertkochia solimangrovi]TRZ46208.1 SusC/RagA family TonB-linked outer membrane protein [Robertkochia solimangrovi]